MYISSVQHDDLIYIYKSYDLISQSRKEFHTLNTSITSHIYHFLWIRTLKFYCLSKLQLHDTIFSYIHHVVHQTFFILYTLTVLSPFPTRIPCCPAPGNHLPSSSLVRTTVDLKAYRKPFDASVSTKMYKWPRKWYSAGHLQWCVSAKCLVSDSTIKTSTSMDI